MDFYDASSNLDASITLNVSNGDLEFALPGGGKIVLGNASQNVQIGGNLTVNGTTTTINSTTTTVDDPIFTLGGDTAPGSDDNKDRGIEFRWHNGTVAKVGFFGYDDSTGKFTFIPDATNTSEVFSGTKGTIDANIEWNDILNKPASSGTVTQIDTNNGITGGPITTTGTVGLTGQALALHNLATNGLIARTGSGTVAGRSIAQGTGISVSNGDGVSGNPTIGVDSTVALRADTHFIGTTSVALNRASANLALTGISSVTLPGATSGTVLLQPAATAGTTTITLPATTGTVVTTGDSGTVTSTMIADGTIVNGDINASAAIAITKLAASTISGISLGNNLATLTISTGLTGTSYNGSTAVTIGIDSSVVTTTGSQTLTNKTFTDSTTLFQDDVDNTKKLAFQLSGISASTTRTLTIPNVSGTIITTGDTGTVTSTMIADGTIVNGDINASAAIAITKLAASTISGVSLGNNLNALTIGTGLSGTSYNGSAAVTIAIDSTVATLTGSQTLTNKTFTDNTTTFQDDVDNTKKMQFQLSGISASTTRTLTIPNNSGTIALLSDITGGTPGGSNTQVQFNNSGAFGGDAGLTYNSTTDTLTIGGDLDVNGGDITTTAATATLFNATATTLSIGGAATQLNIGGITTGTSYVDIGSGNGASGSARYIRLGANGQAGSSTYIQFGPSNSGTISYTFNGSSIGVPGILTVGNGLEFYIIPDSMSGAGYSNINNVTSGWLTINTGTTGVGIDIGDVDQNQAGTKITIDPVNDYIDLVTPRTLLNGSLTFGDGSVQTTKTPDFILFDMGII